MTATAAPAEATAPARTGGGPRPATLAWAVLLGLTSLFALAWLGLGAVVALAPVVPGLADPAADPGSWARAIADATARSEPGGQAVVDYVLSLAAIVLAVALLRRAPRWWVARWLVVALVGSAGAFNLQAHAAAAAAREAVGVEIGGVHQVVLHGVACLAYVVALLLHPTGRPGVDAGTASGRLVVAGGSALLLVVGVGTALLPHTVSCVLFFGAVVPGAGLLALTHRQRSGRLGAEQRTQVRLVVSVLLAAAVTTAVLGVMTAVLLVLGRGGLELVDPTAQGADAPTGPLFWSSRVASVAIAVAVLIAADRARLWSAERRFGRGLAVAVLVVVAGGTVAVTQAALAGVVGEAAALVLAVVVGAALFPVLSARIERVVDQLLYGRRPTPYSALAGIVALTGPSDEEGPDVAAIAEAVGVGLGARWCRLTVTRPGLRDRTYRWAAAGSEDEDTDDGTADEGLEVTVRRGDERIGTLAVDRGAGAGLDAERRRLLADVADSLSPVLEAGRLGIDLERQLRAAVSHAEQIAASRRQVVAEMDHERRTIERDLHDGAQHHLVSLRLGLGLVEHHLRAGRLETARERLADALERVATTEATLAETATGVSSLVLSERGVVPALAADLHGAEPPVRLTSELADDRRFAPEVETAVYFCCLEAVNNARKHAPGAAVTVWVGEAEGVLQFRVTDDGPGFDPATSAGAGAGLRNLRTRLRRAGGTISLDAAPGRGTTVEGRVPVGPADRSGPAEAAPAPAPSPLPEPEPPVEDGTEVLGPSLLDSRTLTLTGFTLDAFPASAVSATATTTVYRLPDEAPGGEPGAAEAAGPGEPDEPTTGEPGPPESAEPVDDEPVDDEPAVDEPAAGEPAAGEPAAGEPAAGEPVAEEPAAEEPVEEPAGEQPATEEPVEEPAGEQPATEEPAEEPAAGTPAVDEPPDEPADEDPGPTAPAPTMPQPRREPVTALTPLAAVPAPRAPLRAVPPGPPSAGQVLLDRVREILDEARGVWPAAAPPGARVAEVRARLEGPLRLTVRSGAALAPGVTLRAMIGDHLARGAVIVDDARPDGIVVLTGTGHIPRPPLPHALVPAGSLGWSAAAVERRLVLRSEVLRARTAVEALELLLRDVPRDVPRDPRTDRLRHRLEGLRVGTHALVEVELLAHPLRLAPADQERAERLWGGDGDAPHRRLGLPSTADPAALREAVAAERGYWQLRLAHPGVTRDLRVAAQAALRTCDELRGRLGR
ncbi:ATP-binding protein [Actinomycetospora straminea]|uniref:histidine kinase n=1 Tax=Actinomycetospora straminea TaxID=663607 RepID=A0ABP9E6F4_9PSEU|nr:ATP-binding protein [Actinomycetospora straminea]MDD7935956.1 histidine kinase [Actinomycetospora straminea]